MTKGQPLGAGETTPHPPRAPRLRHRHGHGHGHSLPDKGPCRGAATKCSLSPPPGHSGRGRYGHPKRKSPWIAEGAHPATHHQVIRNQTLGPFLPASPPPDPPPQPCPTVCGRRPPGRRQSCGQERRGRRVHAHTRPSRHRQQAPPSPAPSLLTETLTLRWRGARRKPGGSIYSQIQKKSLMQELN